MSIAVCLLAACGGKKNNQNPEEMNTLTNKEKAVALLKAIETGENEPIGYVNAENYKQHNLGVEDGLDGFGRALAGLADFPEKAKVNTVRAFEDGDYVVCQTDYNFFGPKAGFDIFRFEDGKIVEHWDNLMPYNGQPNPSGHTPFDGTTEMKDLDKTEANKALVRNFVQDVLMGQHPENLTHYFDGNNYIQHNVSIADGLDGLGAALAAMAEQGIRCRPCSHGGAGHQDGVLHHPQDSRLRQLRAGCQRRRFCRQAHFLLRPLPRGERQNCRALGCDGDHRPRKRVETPERQVQLLSRAAFSPSKTKG